MKALRAGQKSQRTELGRYIVIDPGVCHGKVTFKGTRIFVADVLEDIEKGLSWEFIIERWGGKLNREALAEAAMIAKKPLQIEVEQ